MSLNSAATLCLLSAETTWLTERACRHPQGPVTDEELLGELHDAAAVVYQEDEDKGDDDEDAETEIVDDSSGSSTGHGPIELSAIPAVERHV